MSVYAKVREIAVLSSVRMGASASINSNIFSPLLAE